MAITLTTEYQDIASASFSYTYTYNYTWTVTIQARYRASSVSGNSATIRVRARITNSSSNGWYGTNRAYNVCSQEEVADDPSGEIAAGASFYTREYDLGTMTGGTTRSVDAMWRVMNYSATATGDATMPVFSTVPSGGSITDVTSTSYSISGTLSIESWGSSTTNAHKRLCVLQAGHYITTPGEPQYIDDSTSLDLTTTHTVSTSSQAVNNPTWSIQPNKGYNIGLFAETQNGSYRYNYPNNPVYTAPPTPLSVTSGAQSYNTFSRINVPLTVSYPADGGDLTKTIQYRTQKGSDSYSDWQTLFTVNGGTVGSNTTTIILDSSSTYTIEVRSRNSAGISPSTVSTTVTTLQTHAAPIFSNFRAHDTQSNVVAVTGSNQIFVQGLSNLRVEVPIADIAQPSDPDYPVTRYRMTFEGASQNVNWSSSQVVYAIFGAPRGSGPLSVTVRAIDSLEAYTDVAKNITVLPYSQPNLSITVTRIDESGTTQLSVAGIYSPLLVNGVAKNTITAEYKLSDNNGTIIDWTPISLTTTGTEYSGSVSSIPTDLSETYLLEVRAVDAFNTVEDSVTISAYDEANLLDAPQYSLEVWTRDGEFIADISKYLTSDLNITWSLDDIEELSCSVSLDALELLRQNGASTISLLTPYAHDVKVRRNGEYIVGCQVVEANISINAEQIPTVQIKATGYLNIFKDQYISEPMAGYTYPEMAHKLINRAQHASCLIKNPTGDIDASYWLSPTGAVAQTTVVHAGAGALQCVKSGTGFRGLGTQVSAKAGTRIKIDYWASGEAGSLYVRERDLINNSSTQHDIQTATLSASDVYQHFSVSYTVTFDNPYILFEQDQTTSTPIRLDNVFVSRDDDTDALNNQYIGCIYQGLDDTTGGTGHNYATTGYISTREYNYELQNVKDAIMDLVEMGEDHFDFEFTPDRIFNTYSRKGSDRTDIEIMYPGNVQSMTVDRSAADMANKIQEIGSGIGDERLEVIVSDIPSRTLYGTRESVTTQNNVSLEDTLQGLAQGELDVRGKLSQNVSVTITDGSINAGNIQTGDVLAVKIGNYLGVLGQQYNPQTPVPMELLGGVEGWYKVKKINSRISQDGVETINLTLEYEFPFGES